MDLRLGDWVDDIVKLVKELIPVFLALFEDCEAAPPERRLVRIREANWVSKLRATRTVRKTLREEHGYSRKQARKRAPEIIAAAEVQDDVVLLEAMEELEAGF